MVILYYLLLHFSPLGLVAGLVNANPLFVVFAEHVGFSEQRVEPRPQGTAHRESPYQRRISAFWGKTRCLPPQKKIDIADCKLIALNIPHISAELSEDV